MEDEKRVIFGIRGADIRGMSERLCSRVVLIKSRMYRLHRHREFKCFGMLSCVVQSLVLDVSKGSVRLHSDSQELPVRKIAV